MPPAEELGQLVELDIDRVHELAKRMAFHIPEDHTNVEVKAACLMIWLGTMPPGKLQDSALNQQFLLLASKELVALTTALYGSAPQT
jgi:hypothetical protein